MQCPLCDRPIEPGRLSSYFELDICPSCAAGQVSQPLSLAGRSIEVLYSPPGGYEFRTDRDWEGQLREPWYAPSDTETPPLIRVKGKVHRPSTVRLKARRRSCWSRWGTGRRLLTGDRIFDRHVSLRGIANDETAALLKHESVRASLLDGSDGLVAIDGGEVVCERCGNVSLNDANDTTRAVLVLLYYLHASSGDSTSL